MGPATPTLSFLLLALIPLVWHAARRWSGGGARSVPAALVLILLPTHALALAIGDAYYGLIASLLITGAVGAAFRGRGGFVDEKFDRRACWGAALVAVVYGRVIWHANFDLAGWQGHLATASAIGNGPYPPRIPNFPQLEMSYHYAFDLLTSIVATLTRLRVDYAANLLTIASFALSFGLAWRIGEILGGRRAAPWTAVLACFGGGLPFGGLRADESGWIAHLVGHGMIHGTMLQQPNATTYFQHPWDIGLPLFYLLLILFLETDGLRGGGWRVRSLFLAASITLAFSEIILFLASWGAFLGAGLTDRQARVRWRALIDAAIILAVASRLHGFFGSPFVQGFGMGWNALGILGPTRATVLWNALSFGVLLPLGFWGVSLVPPAARRFFVFFLVGNLVILNTLSYRYAFDVLKFAMAASVALALLSGLALCRVWEGRPRWLVPPAVGLAIGWSVVGLALFWSSPGRLGIRRGISHLALSKTDREAAEWLRRLISARELIYRRENACAAYALWGGLGVVWPDAPVAYSHGIPLALIEERQALERGLPSDPRSLRKLGVGWILLDGADPTRDRERAREWLATNRLRAEAKFDDLTVYRLVE